MPLHCLSSMCLSSKSDAEEIISSRPPVYKTASLSPIPASKHSPIQISYSYLDESAKTKETTRAGLSQIKCSMNFSISLNPPLFALWQCQSKAWIKEEGDANDICYRTISINWEKLTPHTLFTSFQRDPDFPPWIFTPGLLPLKLISYSDGRRW